MENNQVYKKLEEEYWTPILKKNLETKSARPDMSGLATLV